MKRSFIFPPGRLRTEPTTEPVLSVLLRGARAELESNGFVRPRYLADIFIAGKGSVLPDWLHDHLADLLSGTVRRKVGREEETDAAFDFRFGPAEALYQRALRVFDYRRRKLRRASLRSHRQQAEDERTSSEQALDYVLDAFKKEMNGITRRGLANSLSRYRAYDRGRRLDFPDDLHVDPSDP